MNMHSRLPMRITLLLLLVLTITAWNVVRLATSIAWHDTLETYSLRPGPSYIGLTGLIWTLIGLFLLWSFWRGAPWTRWVLLIAAGLYAAWVWADRLLVQVQMRANWPFDLFATGVLLVYTVAIVLDPRNQIYFIKRGL